MYNLYYFIKSAYNYFNFDDYFNINNDILNEYERIINTEYELDNFIVKNI